MSVSATDHYFSTLRRAVTESGRLDRLGATPMSTLIPWAPFAVFGTVATPLMIVHLMTHYTGTVDTWFRGEAPPMLPVVLLAAAIHLLLSVGVATTTSLIARCEGRRLAFEITRRSLLYFVSPWRLWCWIFAFFPMVLLRWPAKWTAVGLLIAMALLAYNGQWIVLGILGGLSLFGVSGWVIKVRVYGGTPLDNTSMMIGPLLKLFGVITMAWVALVGIVMVVVALVVACAPMAGPGWLLLNSWSMVPGLAARPVLQSTDAIALCLLVGGVSGPLPLLLEQLRARTTPEDSMPEDHFPQDGIDGGPRPHPSAL